MLTVILLKVRLMNNKWKNNKVEEKKELWIWLVVQGNLEANDYQCNTLISTLTLIRTWLVILWYEG
jgi:hypothetical protein